jgi:hypothetical protein
VDQAPAYSVPDIAAICVLGLKYMMLQTESTAFMPADVKLGPRLIRDFVSG